MCRWILHQLGADVPLHFSAFHPDHKMSDVPPTPIATLVRARDIALREGLHHVYTGNVHYRDGDTTRCPGCSATLIERDWYRIDKYRVTAQGHCPDCGLHLAGRFDTQAGHFGRRRIPIAIGA
jgi:pyruvate formate lyase activating enzyme